MGENNWCRHQFAEVSSDQIGKYLKCVSLAEANSRPHTTPAITSHSITIFNGQG